MFQAPSNFQWLPAILGLWPNHSKLSSQDPPPLCLCGSSPLCLYLIRTPVFEFRTHPNPGSHLKKSAKNLFLNEIPLTGSRT